MCGLAGAAGAIDPGLLDAVRAAARAQRHRGPDDEGFWQSGGAGGQGAILAFRRLAILDLSPDGHQPMVDAATGNVIAFNGEIYNFVELRRELADGGRAFRSCGDTEVILAAYARWGIEALARLRGMFALALWDAQQRRLVLARDRVGIKPLYFCTVARPGGQQALLFASELRALLATGLVARRLCRAAIASYAWNGFVVGPETIVDGVRLLAAGMHATFACDTGRLHSGRYWRLPGARPAADGVEALRHELRSAVRQHLVSDVPLGVFLSGGIDSSAVAAVAARVAPPGRRLRTFTLGFDEAGYDEAAAAARVAKALGTEHATVRLTQSCFQEQLETALCSLDQPTFDGLNSYFVSRAVREAGIKVALSGVGGDELFGGYRSFRDVPRAASLGHCARRVPERWLRCAARGLAAVMARRRGGVAPQTRWGKLGDALATRGRLVAAYQTCRALFTVDFARELLGGGRDLPLRCGLPAQRFEELEALAREAPTLHAVSTLELATFVGERLVRDIDAASMAVSLETRVPLLDHQVIEAAARVPPARRFEPLGRKGILRELALAELDASMFDRPKAGFVLPIEVWARQRLRGEVERTLGDRARCESCGLAPAATGRLWRAFAAGAPGLYWSRVWAVYVLLWWARAHRASIG